MVTHLGTSGISSEIRETARYLYESTRLTFAAIAAEVGAGERTVKRWSATDGGWRRLSSPKISARAQFAADKINAAVGAIGPDANPKQQQKVIARVREADAVDNRASILARHRFEWNVTRELLNEAINTCDFERAKLAKISAETLAVVQDNESRAWGLNQSTNKDFTTVVVIERGT